ncbi:MAG: UvrD-helicase domain-containing protein [Lentimicrobiaceae bacterium]|nr:UvrD-helicase domain-containing protein [Lentimicrobiaceae bacterium]
MSETNNLLIYKSSAGSGKTYTLVLQYLQLALTDIDNFGKIIAVTFTNKAAEEMKQRVLKYLNHLANPEKYKNTAANTTLLKTLCENLNLSPQQVSDRAKECLFEIIHNYDNFSMKTIDSFLVQVARSFNKDLNLPYNFTIELENKVIIDEAIDNVFSKINSENTEITNTLLDYTYNRIEDEKGWNFKYNLAKSANFLFDEGTVPHLDKLSSISYEEMKSINDAMRKYIDDKETQQKNWGKQALKLLADNNISSDCLLYTTRGVYSYLKKAEFSPAGKRALDAYNDDKWINKKNASQDVIERFYLIQDELNQLLGQMISATSDEEVSKYNLYKILTDNNYNLLLYRLLLSEINDIYEVKKSVHLSEINKNISKIVTEEPVPFIYEKIGTYYKNFLIDEFQDTSELQWIEFIPLISNSLASGNKNLIVGDAKQSIYRFRNSNVQQFVSLPKLPENFKDTAVYDEEQNLEQNAEIIVLDNNYRSKKEIINFNNEFYKFLSETQTDFIKEVYTDVEQKVGTSKQNGGYVQITFAEKNNSKTDNNYTPTFDDTNEDEINKEEENAFLTHTLSIVNQAIENSFDYSDIAILVEKNAQAQAVVDFLYKNNIPSSTTSNLKLKTSKKVQFINNMLSYIVDDSDIVTSANILAYLTESELIDKPFVEVINQLKKSNLVSVLQNNGFNFHLNMIQGIAVYEIVEYIINTFKLNTQPDPFIDAYRDFIYKSANANNNNIIDILADWELRKENLSISTPDNFNAVNVLTIHGSKGLEFPIVIWLVFENPKRKYSKDYSWILHNDKIIKDETLFLYKNTNTINPYSHISESEQKYTELEKINKMYVATTRAAEQLYILACKPEKDIKGLDDYIYQPEHALKAFVESDICNFITDDEIRYSIGTMAPKVDKKQTIQPAFKIDKFPNFKSWKENIIVAPVSSKKYSESNADNNWGNWLHSILSNINSNTDIKKAIDTQLLQYKITPEQLAETEIIIKQVTEHELLSKYFTDSSWKVLSEIEIVEPSGKLHRPDKIFVKKDNAVLLEFKTGKELPDHKQQILRYKTLLTQMNYHVEHCYLIYLHNPVDLQEI